MEHRQTRMQRIWVDAVESIMPKLQCAMRGQRIYQSSRDRETQFYHDKEEIKDEAYNTLRQLLLKGSDHDLSLKISRLSFTTDGSAVNIKWSEEVEKAPCEVLQIYHLNRTDPVQVTSLGVMEFEPGAELRELATVKTWQVIAILVKDGETIVRRLQSLYNWRLPKIRKRKHRTCGHFLRRVHCVRFERASDAWFSRLERTLVAWVALFFADSTNPSQV
ncbi:hypothetical protein ON010_g3748 [Phytophthora cinnamomi]|nr:hypothetical protein ON010_g3748 [Phytophthora cinnamomi]